MGTILLLCAIVSSSQAVASGYLRDLPAGYDNLSWAWVSYDTPAVAVIPGSFNRTIFQPLPDTNASNGDISEAYVCFSCSRACLMKPLQIHELEQNGLRGIR